MTETEKMLYENGQGMSKGGVNDPPKTSRPETRPQADEKKQLTDAVDSLLSVYRQIREAMGLHHETPMHDVISKLREDYQGVESDRPLAPSDERVLIVGFLREDAKGCRFYASKMDGNTNGLYNLALATEVLADKIEKGLHLSPKDKS